MTKVAVTRTVGTATENNLSLQMRRTGLFVFLHGPLILLYEFCTVLQWKCDGTGTIFVTWLAAATIDAQVATSAGCRVQCFAATRPAIDTGAAASWDLQKHNRWTAARSETI